MLLILQKKVLPNGQKTGAWDYPDTPNLFKKSFTISPDPDATPPILRQDIFDYSGELELTALDEAVNYTVIEYTDAVPEVFEDLPIKRISMSDILITLPIGTRQELREVYNTGFPANGNSTNAEKAAGRNADLILAYLMVGKDINVNAPKFIEMMNFMLNHLNISVTQAHIDTLRNDILEERRDL